MKEAGSTSRPMGRRTDALPTMGVRRDDPNLQRTVLSTSGDDQRPGVLIIGSYRGEVFVADRLLIYAETLDGEDAIRAWLAQHGIDMTPPSSKTASADKGANEAIRS